MWCLQGIQQDYYIKTTYMYYMYNNGRMLNVNSVAIDRLLKYDVCSYTDGQIYGYTLNANSDMQLPETLLTSSGNVTYDVTFVARLIQYVFLKICKSVKPR